MADAVVHHMRPADEGEQRATPLELFFDLVFVFAITQISHLILDHPTAAGFAQATFLLLVVWWAWTYTTWMTNWFDPARSKPVRLVLIVVMGLSLMMAIAVPSAFGDKALLFAGSYVGVQVIRNAFNVWVTPRASASRRVGFLRLMWWSIFTGAIWIVGAAVGGSMLAPIWIAALVADYAAPMLGYWTPGLGRARTSDWAIDAYHFSERFQLLVIIALGESIVVTGATAYDTSLSAAHAAGVALSFAITAAMWWLYFNFIAERATERLARAADPGKLARDAFTYLHLPIVMGIILEAVASAMVVRHPSEHFHVPIIAVAGPVMYLIGHNLFRLSMARSISINRLFAAFVLLMLLPLVPHVSALVISALILTVLLALIIREEFIVVPPMAADAAANESASGGAT